MACPAKREKTTDPRPAVRYEVRPRAARWWLLLDARQKAFSKYRMVKQHQQGKELEEEEEEKENRQVHGQVVCVGRWFQEAINLFLTL